MSTAAAAAREEGNALYKEGKLVEARDKYRQAAKLAPDQAAPFSNLSAVNFELGEYAVAAEYCRRALSLTGDDGPTAKVQALLCRLAKSYLFGLQVEKAVEVSQKLDASYKDNATIVASASATAIAWAKCEGQPVSGLWRSLFDRVPRQKVSLLDTAEYFPFGNDDPRGVLEASPHTFTGSEISILFCGSGDARNVFQTLKEIGTLQTANKCSCHVTMVDVNSAAIARALIMFDLLLRSVVEGTHDEDEPGISRGHRYILVISYLFASFVMPPMVDKILREDVIVRLIQLLEGNQTKPVYEGIYLPPDAVPAVLGHLKSWARDPDTVFPAGTIRRAGKKATSKSMLDGRFTESTSKQKYASFKDDCNIFKCFGIIAPSKDYRAVVEPELDKGLSNFLAKPSSKKAIKEVEDYVDANWKANLTTFDFAWEDARARVAGEDRDLFVQLDADAPRMADVLRGESSDSFDPNGKGLSACLQESFAEIAQKGVKGIVDGVLTVEMVVGEMGDFLDRLARDALPHRYPGAPRSEGQHPSKFPKTYDAMHLSNIPDYVGGHFATFLNTYPILRDGKSNVQFTCMLNPPQFQTHEVFNAEYGLMPNDDKFRRHLGAYRTREPTELEFPPMMPIYLWDYWTWAKDDTITKKGSEGLMNRPGLEHWLHAHFLKMTLPAYRPPSSDAPVVAPLHFMTFLRLVEHAHAIGYPAHWLSAVLDGLCSGRIRTTARAPPCMDLVMKPEEAERVHAAREMDVSPWAAEFTTTVALWRRLLPFGLLLSADDACANSLPLLLTLPLPEAISEYEIRFQRYRYEGMAVHYPHFALAFWSSASVLAPPQSKIREFLIDDETGTVSHAQKVKLRRMGHVVMAFRYATDEKKATFWMRDDVVAGMLAGGKWKAQIWRMDIWHGQSTIVDVKKRLKRVRGWND